MILGEGFDWNETKAMIFFWELNIQCKEREIKLQKKLWNWNLSLQISNEVNWFCIHMSQLFKMSEHMMKKLSNLRAYFIRQFLLKIKNDSKSPVQVVLSDRHT